MRSNLHQLLFLSVFVLLLAACGGSSPSATLPPSVDNPPVEAQPTATTEASPAEVVPAEATTVEAPAAETGGVSFAADVLPIFEASCTRCHGESRQSGGLRLDSYASLLAGGNDGAVVVPGSAAESWLVELITSGEMPRNAAPLSAEEIALISAWIEAGALED